MRTSRRTAARIVLLALATVSCTVGSISARSANAAEGPPPIDTTAFARPGTNQWWPLEPGTVRVYRGTKDSKAARDVVTVTRRTKHILGVDTVVVRDNLFLDGRLRERTLDYYATDDNGTVWYFGEDTAELDARGRVVTREGTWQAGVHGARPGVVMEATPVVGKAIRQEYLAGHAEDWYRVVTVSHPVTVPYGSYPDALQTEEWTPLEPGVLDHKEYAPGIGDISERAVRGPTEELVLVLIRPAA